MIPHPNPRARTEHEILTHRVRTRISAHSRLLLAPLCALLCSCASAHAGEPTPAKPDAEVRGTWVTTTANDAIASPEKTAQTMRRLREIGLNTVYVECWKNGYTQFPSQVLKNTIGVDRRPALMRMDPSDTPDAIKAQGRDLLQETVIEAHRNGLIYIAWFEYGFMAAHKSTKNDLWKQKPEWLSRDIKGSEIAPNGFVWMNPLHPETRKFLLDLVLEAIDKYDLDGIQLDDRIVWPYYTMGYDDYTRSVYAKEHDGKQPPEDPKDAEWVAWRAAKVNEYSKEFVQSVRLARPGIIVSLSPAPYPWCYEYYLLEWPKWAAWMEKDAISISGNPKASAITPRWDEFVPQCYRMNYSAFETTWKDQITRINTLGAGRVADMYSGIRVVGEGPDLTWDDLKKSIELTRSSGSKGHVLWFSRGVLDVYPKQLTEFYDVAHTGPAPHPKFNANWRPASIRLTKGDQFKGGDTWNAPGPIPASEYSLIVKHAGAWQHRALTAPERTALLAATKAGSQPFSLGLQWLRGAPLPPTKDIAQSDGFEHVSYDAVELLIDRRAELNAPPTHQQPAAPAAAPPPQKP